MYHEIAGTLVLIAAVPRKECVKLPASRAACCFKKRVCGSGLRRRRGDFCAAGAPHLACGALPDYGAFQALNIVGGVLAVIALVLISAAMIVGRARSRRH
jgi:hypothetical protein